MDDRVVIEEKLQQAPAILRETGVDLWLTFARESSTLHDPCLDLIVGSDCTWQSAFILTSGGQRVAIVGNLDQAHFQALEFYPRVIGYVGSIRQPLLETLNRFRPQRIAINRSKNDVMADGLTSGLLEVLMDHLEGTGHAENLVSSEAIVGALRGRKTVEEQRRIQAACDVTVEMFQALTPRLRVGMTEKEVADILVADAAERGLDLAWDPAMCPAVFTGPDASGGHSGPTQRRIEPGHVMSIDFGVRVDGYCSDLQRTWYFLQDDEDAPPESVKHGFEVLRGSIDAALEALRPGRKSIEIDTIARSHITERGYPEYEHALGHQVGRKAHDGGAVLCPRWDRYGNLPDSLIEAGQCYTIEPRLPIDGHGVVTIEDIAVVQEDASTWLSRPQTSLIVVGPT